MTVNHVPTLLVGMVRAQERERKKSKMEVLLFLFVCDWARSLSRVERSGSSGSPGEGATLKQKSFRVFYLMPAAYIIYSEKIDKFYVGKSENFPQRLLFHNSDENEKWSKSGRPWAEYLVINCKTFKQAGKIERYIKAQKSRKCRQHSNAQPGY
jgi:putative endonuclease